MKITLQDSIEYANNESAQKLLEEKLQSYLHATLSCGADEHEKRLEAVTAYKVLKDYADKLTELARRNQ